MIFTPGRDEIVRRAAARLPPARPARRRRCCGRARASASRLVRLDRDVPDRLPDLLRVGVDDDGDVDPVLGEDRGRAAIACPSRPAPTSATLCWPWVRRILRISSSRSSIDVADPALAELAEVGQVAADLGRVDVRVLGDLLRRDPRPSPSSAPASAPGGTGTGGRRRRRSSAQPHDPLFARLRNSVLLLYQPF